MKIRDKITFQKQRAIRWHWIGCITMFIGIGLIAFTNFVLVAVAMICGYIIIMIGTFRFFAIKCPKCGENLGLPTSYPMGWSWRVTISNKIKFCQFCGVSLDTEIE